jgi:hypothetical protein
MKINIKRMISTKIGKGLLSILMGLGLASMFQQVCKGKNCITYRGPVLDQVEGKVYEFDHKCYKYDVHAVTCDKTQQYKRVIDIAAPDRGL